MSKPQLVAPQYRRRNQALNIRRFEIRKQEKREVKIVNTIPVHKLVDQFMELVAGVALYNTLREFVEANEIGYVKIVQRELEESRKRTENFSTLDFRLADLVRKSAGK